jgi:hypothetical protein
VLARRPLARSMRGGVMHQMPSQRREIAGISSARWHMLLSYGGRDTQTGPLFKNIFRLLINRLGNSNTAKVACYLITLSIARRVLDWRRDGLPETEPLSLLAPGYHRIGQLARRLDAAVEDVVNFELGYVKFVRAQHRGCDGLASLSEGFVKDLNGLREVLVKDLDGLREVLAPLTLASAKRRRTKRSPKWHWPAQYFAAAIERELQGVAIQTRRSARSPLVLAVCDLLKLAGPTVQADAVRKLLGK